MNKTEVGLFILRVVFGLTFLMHGLDKFSSGIDGTAGFFESIEVPGFMAGIVALIEVIGGLAILLGFATRLFSAIFAIIMMGAIYFAKLPAGFLGGYELDLILLATSILFLLNGSRFLAISALFSGKLGKI
ncbi:DoxX family protein [Shouchella shacheensis]|uniref:DoxX family protein n=1 Tax=Shouchella shacheensis TaxID=1649580 RepID=UPI00074054AB|nr:DoxX family protein [Shouchella shacheensis]